MIGEKVELDGGDRAGKVLRARGGGGGGGWWGGVYPSGCSCTAVVFLTVTHCRRHEVIK